METILCVSALLLFLLPTIIGWIGTIQEKNKAKREAREWENRQSRNTQTLRSTQPPRNIQSPLPNPPPRNYSTSTSESFPISIKETNPPSSAIRPKPRIEFREIKEQSRGIISSNVGDLHDALTGAPLNVSLGLYQCKKCKVFYHIDSYKVLTEINSSACVSCKSTDIKLVPRVTLSNTGLEYSPDVITLDNYRNFVGQVVTFEGIVREVKVSKYGNDFAVMFEYKSWIKGFKLVFFKRDITKFGGKSAILNMDGKTIKVRGLIVKHDTFGYQIVVSEKEMILGIRS
jgi:hypothetical protein